MISFSIGLIVFTLLLTAIYLVLLMSTKENATELEIRKHSLLSAMFSTLSFVISVASFILTLTIDFRETMPYFAVVVVVPFPVILSRILGGWGLEKEIKFSS
jgi:hypothetical protein